MKKLFSFIALAFVACSALVITSCGSDSNTSYIEVNGGSGSSSTTTKWCYTSSRMGGKSGKACNYIYGFTTIGSETLKSVKAYWGKSSDVAVLYGKQSTTGLTEVALEKQESGNYILNIDASESNHLMLAYFLVATSESGKTQFMSPTEMYDGSYLGLTATIDSVTTVDSLKVTITGIIHEEARSQCSSVAICRMGSFNQPSNYICKLCDVGSNGTFTKTASIARGTSTVSLVVVAGSENSTQFNPVVWDTKNLIKVYKKTAN